MKNIKPANQIQIKKFYPSNSNLYPQKFQLISEPSHIKNKKNKYHYYFHSLLLAKINGIKQIYQTKYYAVQTLLNITKQKLYINMQNGKSLCILNEAYMTIKNYGNVAIIP